MQSCFVRAKLVLLIKSGCIQAKWLKSGKIGYNRAKMAVFLQSRCIWEKIDVFGQKWFNSCKVVVFGQKWLYSDKVVLFGQKLLYSGKSDYNREKNVVFEQSGCIRGKVFVFG